MESDESTASYPFVWRRWWFKLAVLIALFLAWAGLGVEELIVACVAAAAAATASESITSFAPGRIRPGGLVHFVPYFLSISFRGGIDVARRAFLPSMPLAPGFVDYRLRIKPQGSAAIFLGCVISLIPGTLCAGFEGDGTVLVHVVDLDAGFEEELERLERKVAAIFGESVDEGEVS